MIDPYMEIRDFLAQHTDVWSIDINFTNLHYFRLEIRLSDIDTNRMLAKSMAISYDDLIRFTNNDGIFTISSILSMLYEDCRKEMMQDCSDMA